MGLSFFNSTILEGPLGYTLVESTDKLRGSTYGVLILCIILLPLSWLALALRVFTRTRLIKAFACDDYAMAFTVVFFTLFASYVIRSCVIVFENLGPIAAGQTPPLAFVTDMYISTTCWYCATMIALKISLGWFFQKIFDSKRAYWWTILVCTIILTLAGIASIMMTALYPCDLATYFFPGLKECVNSRNIKAWVDVAQVWTVLSMVSDLLYAVLSIVAIARIQLSAKKKVTAILLCTVGTMAGTASVARFIMLTDPVKGYSIFGQDILNLQVLVIEPGLGIIAACAATLRPMLREYRQWRERRRDLSGAIEGSSLDRGGSTLVVRSRPDVISELELGEPLKIFATEAGKSQIGMVIQVKAG
ncbi:hypothetical protein K461DRAFT_321931 [Myriangium duriaei CBS 260.36]|uniref:Rhodopsin domain-containing protein n=1 Tax=Myriangium duriaei CBS 260.36 TaxID=1168546 RepID=A0A9P4MEY5_9PEZI|nr:hypothetical protein K461DRAFT_321931 [Myriangium duriaei CBS 260.36]